MTVKALRAQSTTTPTDAYTPCTGHRRDVPQPAVELITNSGVGLSRSAAGGSDRDGARKPLHQITDNSGLTYLMRPTDRYLDHALRVMLIVANCQDVRYPPEDRAMLETMY